MDLRSNTESDTDKFQNWVIENVEQFELAELCHE
jgi:hypothetical protein